MRNVENKYGKPVSNELVIDIDMDSDTATEANLSLKSRSFLNRVNDRLRKMMDSSPEDAMQDVDQRSMIWGMFMGFHFGSICFPEKESLRQFTFHSKNTEDLTMTQMSDISEKLTVGKSDEFFFECLRSAGKILMRTIISGQ